ncbi:MAG: hypothetical protein NC328_06400 [Muribaculum sp.]|nr:hypothetical protein [Muribaculum sp.]
MIVLKSKSIPPDFVLFKGFRPVLVALVILAAGVLCRGAGYIHIENFARSSYKAGPQNWAFVTDKTGRIYIGNQNGMLIFDGRIWQLAAIKNYTSVRSLLYDESAGRIYAGGSGEFGYFYHDQKQGILKYTSISEKLSDKMRFFTEIWKIYNFHDNIWYQSDHHLFCMNGNSIASFPVEGRISTSALIGNYIFVALEDGKILRFNGNTYDTVNDSGTFAGKKIIGFMSLRDKPMIVATATDGLYKFDGSHFSQLDLPCSTYLKNNRIFSATASGTVCVFGTVDGGAVIHNFNSGETSFVNKQLGLINNTVLSSYIDGAGDIWLGLDNGIAFACYNTRITELIRSSDNIGAGYASLRLNDNIFLGTNQGLYSLSVDPADRIIEREPVRQLIKGQIWALDNIDGTLFISSDTGLFYRTSQGNFSHIIGLPGTHRVIQLPGKPDYALASTYEKFHLLYRNGNLWTDLGPVDGYDDIGGNFVIDDNMNVWIPHFRRGIYKLSLSKDLKSFTNTRLLTIADGLPDNQNNTITLINGKPVFLTNYGFYKPDYDHKRAINFEKMNKTFGGNAVRALFSFPNGITLWVSDKRLNFARTAPDGHLVVDSTGLKLPTQGFMEGHHSVSAVAPGKYLISNQEGFWCLDTEKRINPGLTIRPFVNTIYANGDSIVYEAPFSGATQMSEKLPYHLNSLRFIIAYPDYSAGNDILFSTMLEDYDSDWSQYSELATREFTHLREGNYTLHFRAKDIRTGEIQESLFRFTIMPPWYRSTAAYVCYLLLILSLVFMAYKCTKAYIAHARLKALRQKEIELQDLRESAQNESLTKNLEIATLKSEQLEQDIRHKSQQLSDTAMSLIHKNEILQEISDKIESIRNSPGASQIPPAVARQLASLQKSVKNDIGKDDDWKSFHRNFDIVYGDFTKKLIRLHPSLTISDQRLCCYIRMGLSSKEISPLINISYKSVEMARYRLRKKIGLTQESSLQEYLAKL